MSQWLPSPFVVLVDALDENIIQHNINTQKHSGNPSSATRLNERVRQFSDRLAIPAMNNEIITPRSYGAKARLNRWNIS